MWAYCQRHSPPNPSSPPSTLPARFPSFPPRFPELLPTHELFHPNDQGIQGGAWVPKLKKGITRISPSSNHKHENIPKTLNNTLPQGWTLLSKGSDPWAQSWILETPKTEIWGWYNEPTSNVVKVPECTILCRRAPKMVNVSSREADPSFNKGRINISVERSLNTPGLKLATAGLRASTKKKLNEKG